MKENYLHDKLRKLQAELDELKKDNSQMKTEMAKFKNIDEANLHNLNNAMREWENKVVGPLIESHFDDQIQTRLGSVYNDLQGAIKKQLRRVVVDMREYTDRFSEQVVEIKKFTHATNRTLFKKGIIFFDEFKEASKEVDEMLDEDMRRDIKHFLNARVK